MANVIPAQEAAALDFDGDGKADFVFITVGSNGALSWRAQDIDDNVARNLGTFGTVGDQIAAGKWSTTSQQRAALSATTKQIQWAVDTLGSFSLGAVGDKALSGIDIDGDGLLDAFTVSKVLGRYQWQVRSSKTAKVKKIIFGTEGDMSVLVKKSNGTSVLGVVRKGKPYPTLYYIAVSNPKVISKVTLRASETLEKFTQATPLRWATGEAALAFSKRIGAGMKIIVVSLKTGKVLKRLAPANGNEITVGDYLGVGTDQIALQTTGATLSLISKTGTQDLAINGSGIAIDEFNSNTILTKSATPAPPTPPVQAPVSRTRPNEPMNPASCVLQVSADGGGGFVWKPISDTQHFAVAVLPPTYTGIVGRIDVWSSAGAYVKELPGKGAGNGNRTAWQDTSLTGGTYKSRYGSIVLVGTNYAGGCSKWVISDPSKRID